MYPGGRLFDRQAVDIAPDPDRRPLSTLNDSDDDGVPAGRPFENVRSRPVSTVSISPTAESIDAGDA